LLWFVETRRAARKASVCGLHIAAAHFETEFRPSQQRALCANFIAPSPKSHAVPSASALSVRQATTSLCHLPPILINVYNFTSIIF
jgi:hypothetical protein